jgi:hypothetical protein
MPGFQGVSAAVPSGLAALGGVCAIGACVRSVPGRSWAAASSIVGCAEGRPTAWYPSGLLRDTPLPPTQWATLRQAVCQPGGRSVGWGGADADGTGTSAPLAIHAGCAKLQDLTGQPPHVDTGAGAAGGAAQRFAVVLLNTEESCGILLRAGMAAADALVRLWGQASVVVVADGAANHLYDSAPDEQRRRAMLPRCITGDLDSIRPEVRAYYSGCGVEIVEQSSQDSHDFQKSIAVATRLLGQVSPPLLPVGRQGRSG